MNQYIESKPSGYPGKYSEPTKQLDTGETLKLCKKCRCCYSPDGNFCEVSYVSNGNKIYALDRSIPQIFNGFSFPKINDHL